MTRLNLWLFLVLFSSFGWSYSEEGADLSYCNTDGIFVAGDLGLFSRMGSNTTISPEPFVGITVGYEFSRHFSLGLKGASAFVSSGSLNLTDPESPTSFGLYMVNANAMGAIPWTSRSRLTANIFGGLTIMHPASSLGGNPYGANVGMSLGFLYDTFLPDIVLGLNLTGHVFLNLGPAKNLVFGASITPVISHLF